jgi:arylsulfatase A-like enzyme
MKKDLEKNHEVFFKNVSLTQQQKNKLIDCFNFTNITDCREFLWNDIDMSVVAFNWSYHPSNIYADTIRLNTTDKDIDELINSYDNGIYFIDHQITEFFYELEKKGLLKNTIIIITSDHGEELYEHNGFLHGAFYDHTIHIPLIIKIPNLTKKIQIQDLAQSIDIAPTVLSLLQLKYPSEFQGINLLTKKKK